MPNMTKEEKIKEEKLRFRRFAAKNHPDKGGCAHAFAKGRREHEQIMKKIRRSPDDKGCPNCDSGWVKSTVGVCVFEIVCPVCRGTGVRKP